MLIKKLTILLLLTLSSAGFSASEFHGKICSLDENSTECAVAKAKIKRNHPDILVHERDKTVLQGIRAQANTDSSPLYGSLRACLACHISKDKKTKLYPKITDSKHFCVACHKKAAVKLDCFECHSSKPDAVTIRRLNIIELKAGTINQSQSLNSAD